jgi:hypothetical protein
LKYKSPSPDRSGNPFVPGFGTKDWSGKQETAPKKQSSSIIIINHHHQSKNELFNLKKTK